MIVYFTFKVFILSSHCKYDFDIENQSNCTLEQGLSSIPMKDTGTGLRSTMSQKVLRSGVWGCLILMLWLSGSDMESLGRNVNGVFCRLVHNRRTNQRSGEGVQL
ncbi:hypothetical protein RRG08_012362 [Elysia crispata]|uniref:Uncharacterized protein n=1 Tax=Elysia crispata TaxID=231223 RepID=A0AAE1A226_9GAST|nr:hypothetical protein RRG08_012362 [Elysia crispata]